MDTRSRTPPDETFSMLVRPAHPDFLDLPWEAPLAHWRSERVVDVERGIHRHVVRFVYVEHVLRAAPPEADLPSLAT